MAASEDALEEADIKVLKDKANVQNAIARNMRYDFREIEPDEPDVIIGVSVVNNNYANARED